MPLKQDTRALAIKTALDADVLAVRSVSIQEQVSRMFEIQAELSSENGNIDLDKVIGQPATVRLDLTQKGQRYFDGFVSRLTQVGNQGGHAHYRAVIVPWLWFLTRTSDCRIFQEKSVPDIIEEVFKEYGFGDYELKLSGTYEKCDFCVQYRETAFNFVSRLMEQEGIYYFFQHQDGKHTMVLADSISAHSPFGDYAEAAFSELAQGAPTREVITDWAVEKEVQPIAAVLTDFDFKKPKSSLLATAKTTRKYGKAQFEIFDYPGQYIEHSDGDRLADVRLNELQSQYELVHGQASARWLAVGSTFKLKGHPRSDQNREYLVTSVHLQIDAGEFASGDQSGRDFFSCSFSAIPKAQQFRPERLTPKPVIQGPQTAIVVGPPGDEIHTDEHARVKVHFHWDRHDQSDQNSSCWIRVSQPWAGKGWGSMATPRMGQEVVIEFLEGDPDQPIITGRVYNGDQAAPYAGGKGVVSGLKSKTHKGSGYNEMSMDDTAGKEKITIHGQFDMNTTVEHDQTTTVHNNRTDKVDVNDSETVGADQAIKIGKNQSTTVGINQTNAIGADRTETVGKNESLSVGLMRTHSVGVNEAINIGAAQEVDIGAAQTVNVGAIQTISVGASQSLSVGSNQTNNIGGKRNTEVAKDDHLKVGKKLSIEAADEISIVTGDAKLVMKKDGTITLEGKDITLKGSGNIAVKASSDVTIKGSKVEAN
ncbi:MAG TPA: type VI secretion system tip protein TssI/VgrG [Verrucomicrobiae bacterium]|nr:type VI secretion system tip protein TssI/VgrG [Verrucomicrobiae bacterium]